ncbi:hypothetical protein LXT12_26480 [Pelomonas sp. P7]|uniref:Uncharacterized protein n=1 Tax=Pelomonas caseinilytica TaxID=2906763 RepID=A0ABS8XPM7_9BURK|nr:hypothetical protein [Pelomonas sp. P7]MCE4540781.1 hypothetical protein [Pelomonas sp. P7]
MTDPDAAVSPPEPDPETQPFDIVTVLGSNLLQPMADHIDRLLEREETDWGVTPYENGYAALLVVAFNMLLESYVARLRFKRRAESKPNLTFTAQLAAMFDDLPRPEALEEVYVIGKATAHNHIWNLELADDDAEAKVLLTPKDLEMATKQSWERIVDLGTRKTRLLGLNAVPTALDRHDVKTVFDVTWSTLQFMASKNHDHTPMKGYHTVRFRKQHRHFADLLTLFPVARPVPKEA